MSCESQDCRGSSQILLASVRAPQHLRGISDEDESFRDRHHRLSGLNWWRSAIGLRES